MQDFEATAENTEQSRDDGKPCVATRVNEAFRMLLKRFVLLISFGPGILGFLWLLGRILKR